MIKMNFLALPAPRAAAACNAIYCSGRCDWIKVKTKAWREANTARGELFNRDKR